MVSSADQALASLCSLVDAIQKRDVRSAYFECQRQRFYVPRLSSIDGSTPEDANNATATWTIPQTCRPAAAAHVANALRSWADRFELPPGEVDVLMSVLGSLSSIVTADPQQLEQLPLEARTKQLLTAFFGSTPCLPAAGASSGADQQEAIFLSKTSPPSIRPYPQEHISIHAAAAAIASRSTHLGVSKMETTVGHVPVMGDDHWNPYAPAANKTFCQESRSFLPRAGHSSRLGNISNLQQDPSPPQLGYPLHSQYDVHPDSRPTQFLTMSQKQQVGPNHPFHQNPYHP